MRDGCIENAVASIGASRTLTSRLKPESGKALERSHRRLKFVSVVNEGENTLEASMDQY
jgi:hypothetical protein